MCILCSQLANKDMEFEIALLKFSNTNQENSIKTLEISNEILQKELRKYIIKYGPVVEDDEEEREEEESHQIL